MIKKVSLHQLNNNELSTLITRLLVAIKAAGSLNVGIVAKILLVVIGLNDKFTKSLNSSLKSQFSELLKKLDKIRDNAFKALRNAILACSQRLNEAYNLQADKLINLIRLHGWSLWRENYQEESAKLNSLIKELESPELQASLSTILLTEWFDELKKSQNDFEDTFYNKANKDERDNYIALSTTRPQLIKETSKLLERINNEIEYSDDPDGYAEFIKTVNNIINETARLAKQRRTKNGHDDEEDDAEG